MYCLQPATQSVSSCLKGAADKLCSSNFMFASVACVYKYIPSRVHTVRTHVYYSVVFRHNMYVQEMPLGATSAFI